MFSHTTSWNGNSFSDLLYASESPVRPVPPWKFGVNPAAFIAAAWPL